MKYSFTEKNGHDYIMLGGGQSAENENAFDHVTLVTVTDEGPEVANLRLDGILDKYGHIPAGETSYAFKLHCAPRNDLGPR